MLSNQLKSYSSLSLLASSIESRWQHRNYSSDVFHEVAWDLVDSHDLDYFAHISNQIVYLGDPDVRSVQYDSNFSDTHMQVFDSGRFFIEVLNWNGSHVNTHDHDFSGIQFQLKGESLNIDYKFDCKEQHGSLYVGKCKIDRVSVWRQGSKSKVVPGPFIPHSVYHLDKSTTSLLIRTIPTKRYGSQLNYFNAIAAHYNVQTVIQRKKLAALIAAATFDDNAFREQMSKYIAKQSHSETFFMLLKLCRMVDYDQVSPFLAHFATKGEVEEAIVSSLMSDRTLERVKNSLTCDRVLENSQKIPIVAVAHCNCQEDINVVKDFIESQELNMTKLREVFRNYGFDDIVWQIETIKKVLDHEYL